MDHADIEGTFVAEFSRQPTWTLDVADDGQSARLKNWAVFRAGTFRDSRGRRHSVTVEYLKKTAANFHSLLAIGFQPPIRANHGRNVNEVVGYGLDCYERDGVLYQDVDFTEPDAIAKFKRGTYRFRSSELGVYESNSGERFFPALMGVAFVDTPAVEGLFSMASAEDSVAPDLESHFFMEASMADAGPETETTDTAGTAPGRREFGASTVNIYTGSSNTTSGDDDPEPEPVAAAEPVKFTFGGEEIDDPAEVQRRISEFEAAMTAQRDVNRATFCKGLAEDNKLAAPLIDSMSEFAKSLNEGQWGMFTAMWEDAPELSLFANHADGVTNPDGEDPEADIDLEAAKQVVEFMKRNSYTDEQIQGTAEWRTIQAAEASK